MRESIIRKPLPTEIEAIIKIWLDGNMHAHPFIQPDSWLNHTDYMRQVLPLSEVYVCEVKGEIAGFIGLDGDYIAGLFVSKQYQIARRRHNSYRVHQTFVRHLQNLYV